MSELILKRVEEIFILWLFCPIVQSEVLSGCISLKVIEAHRELGAAEVVGIGGKASKKCTMVQKRCLV